MKSGTGVKKKKFTPRARNRLKILGSSILTQTAPNGFENVLVRNVMYYLSGYLLVLARWLVEI